MEVRSLKPSSRQRDCLDRGVGPKPCDHFPVASLDTDAAEVGRVFKGRSSCTGPWMDNLASYERRRLMKTGYLIDNDSISPSYVVVGEGTPSMEKLTKAHECLERGARLLVTNPDNWCPVAQDKTRPGAGAIGAFLEVSTGRRAYFLGKPNGYMFHRARRKLIELTHSECDQVIMIGDTMETDIRGAVEAGMAAFLVLSGSTQIENVGDYVYQPSRILTTVGDLTAEVKSGTASDRLDSPVFDHIGFTGGKSGTRHQTDLLAFHKPRPRPAMTQ